MICCIDHNFFLPLYEEEVGVEPPVLISGVGVTTFLFLTILGFVAEPFEVSGGGLEPNPSLLSVDIGNFVLQVD
jgi:hypothetical protein